MAATRRMQPLTYVLHVLLFFVSELWDMIGFSETERLAFKPMLVTEEGFTDELLQQHKQEADTLSSRYETMKPILEVRQHGRACKSVLDFEAWTVTSGLFDRVDRCSLPHTYVSVTWWVRRPN